MTTKTYRGYRLCLRMEEVKIAVDEIGSYEVVESRELPWSRLSTPYQTENDAYAAFVYLEGRLDHVDADPWWPSEEPEDE